jgi:hypothetical protein
MGMVNLSMWTRRSAQEYVQNPVWHGSDFWQSLRTGLRNAKPKSIHVFQMTFVSRQYVQPNVFHRGLE